MKVRAVLVCVFVRGGITWALTMQRFITSRIDFFKGLVVHDTETFF